MLSLFQNAAIATTISPSVAAASAAVSSIGINDENQIDGMDDPLNQIKAEMERRSSNPIYVLGRWFGMLIGTVKEDDPIVKPKAHPEKVTRQVKAPVNETIPFQGVYNQIFSQDTLRILYVELDPGVDDGAALLQLLAAKAKGKLDNGKKIEIVGIVPCVGNAILAQTELNTMQFLTLTGNQDIKVYPGAIAPLAIAGNQTAVQEMNAGINATHFYGHDGESDVGGWPQVTMSVQTQPGYQFAAQQIFSASPDTAITLVSTSALTELSKTLTQLEKLDADNHLPPGSFAKKINAISIMGGCVSQTAGCNAPFNVPDNQKNSEANFYFDTPAAQFVFATCQKYGIPILLAPLDLTQQAGLLWSKTQDDMLSNTNNDVARQMARVTDVVPYLDAPCFPNGTYPMHDLQAATNLLFPDLYSVTKAALIIGDVGQITLNDNATDYQKTVYIMSMSQANQLAFYQKVIPAYQQFNKSRGFSTLQWGLLVVGGASLVGLGAFGATKAIKTCRAQDENDEEKQLIADKNNNKTSIN